MSVQEMQEWQREKVVALYYEQKVEPNLSLEEVDWTLGKNSLFIRTFLIEKDGALAAAVTWEWMSPNMVEISMLAVSNKYKRNGLASKLVSESLRDFNEFWRVKWGKDITDIYIRTEENNTTARNFYRKVLKPNAELVFGGQVFFLKELKSAGHL